MELCLRIHSRERPQRAEMAESHRPTKRCKAYKAKLREQDTNGETSPQQRLRTSSQAIDTKAFVLCLFPALALGSTWVCTLLQPSVVGVRLLRRRSAGDEARDALAVQ
eukprot:3115485-Pleurochrysis_carterae.AAC.1